MKNKIKSVEYSTSTYGYKLIIKEFKSLLFRSLISNKFRFFFQPQDAISVNPIVNGEHEPDLTRLISHFNEIGYCDFFIDIGANIGLTSCQNGSVFKKVICFEPNPLCLHILKVNTEIALSNTSFEINEFGLGSYDADLDLYIPKHNWGGAFVKGDDNSYSEKVLATKDEFLEIDENNYFIKKIQIRSCKDTLDKKFSSLSNDGLNNGVIKIDVEGMEKAALKGISQSIPDNFNAMIVFENWDPNFNFDEVKEYFSAWQNAFFMLSYDDTFRNNRFKNKWEKLVHSIALLFSKSQSLLIPYKNSKNKVGDIVIQLGDVIEPGL